MAFFQLLPTLQAVQVEEGSEHYSTYNSMLFTSDFESLLLVPEGLEGNAVLPAKMASVPACAFSRCTKLSAISVDTAGSMASIAFSSKDGILYTNDLTTLVAAPAGIGASAVVAPECTTIAEGAFFGNVDLQTIISAGSVESIETGVVNEDGSFAIMPAFSEQTIKTATVVTNAPESWQAIGFANFEQPAQPGDTSEVAGEEGLTFTLLDDYTLAVSWTGEDVPASVVIPESGIVAGVEYSVSTIADGAFEGLTNLQAVYIPETIKAIGKRAFADTSLDNFVVPMQLQAIDDEAFAGIDGITIVDIANTCAVSKSALAGVTDANIYMPYADADDYNWKAGVPSAGNVLHPFGVKLGADIFSMKVGETVPLFEGEGYLYATGEVYPVVTYPAKSFSIDTESGTITALAAGNIRFHISLAMDMERLQPDGSIKAEQIVLVEP